MRNSLNPDAPEADMTPAERKVWLASHNAPAQYLLVTVDEMQVMMAGVRKDREVNEALQRTFRRAELVLLEYWKSEPDLPQAIAAAVFDATRYKKGVNTALPGLRKVVEKLEAAIRLSGGLAPTVVQDFHDAKKAIEDLIEFLNKQTELRRNRKDVK